MQANTETLDLKMMDDGHLSDMGDICFYQGKLLSVADDGVLKVFNINSQALVGQPQLKEHAKIELGSHCGEVNSIATNQLSQIALGGSPKTVEIFTLEENNDFSRGAELFGKANSFLSMKFNSPVTKIRYNGSNWLLGFSKDEHVGVYNTEN